MEKPNELFDFEDWEADALFYENEDWVGLLKIRKERYELSPHDEYAQFRYGEAMVFNEKYQEAIDFLSPVYLENPEFIDVIHTILDALFKQGKTENDFKWVKLPYILGLDENTKQICIEELRKKRKKFSIAELYGQLLITGAYLRFKEIELAEYLKMDNRFCLEGNIKSSWDIDIKLSKN